MQEQATRCLGHTSPPVELHPHLMMMLSTPSGVTRMAGAKA